MPACELTKKISNILVLYQILLIFAQKYIDMKKVIFSVLILCGCSSQYPPSQSVIEHVCKEVASDTLKLEEIAHWDSLNTEGEYLLIRGAERNLDTIVNHMHLIFTTEQ